MALLQDLIQQIDDQALRKRILKETDKLVKQKKFGLVFEEHLPECTPLYDMPIRVGAKVALKTGYVKDIYTVLKMEGNEALCDRRETHEKVSFQKDEIVVVAEFGEPIYPTLKPIDSVENAPESDLWHALIEADNYHALQLLEYLYAEKVDCIYIDPPYNTGAKDWKYNNDYVDVSDSYRHSKWLSFIEKRLKLAKKLLNPKDSALIVTIDEKEYLHLGCLLEEVFPEANIQMVSTVINPAGVSRGVNFARTDEYIFYVLIGEGAVQRLPLEDEWRLNAEDKRTTKMLWSMLIRTGTHVLRADSKNQFYPIYVYEDGKKIHSVGEPFYGENRNEISAPKGTVAIWPIRSNGDEGNWQVSAENLRKLIRKGYVKLGRFSERGMAISYLKKGEIEKVESGVYEISGHREDGSVISDTENRAIIPGTQWRIAAHDASRNGTNMLTKVLGEKRFSYPKSLYAERDAIKFVVANKPRALIVDFFAGSGTTLHAVNLINAEDNGQRRCIMVTNNEVSVEEATVLTSKGYKPGDEEWERQGIANYVTWPRTTCSIRGCDIKGEPLQGEYISTNIKKMEKERTFKQISFIKDASLLNVSKKKEIISFCCKGVLPQSLVKKDSRFIVSDDEKHPASILFDDTAVDEWIEALDGMEHIVEFYIVTAAKNKFISIKERINEVLGNIKTQESVGIPMAEGFKANVVFYKLSFLDKTEVALGMQFRELLPVFWMKGGAVGKCPFLDCEVLPHSLILPGNKMAILIDEIYYSEFDVELAQHPEIRTIFIVTDSESAYREMIRAYEGKTCYQLYRDYLDNFRINTGR